MGIDPGFAALFTKLAIDVFIKSVALLAGCGLFLKIFRYRPAAFHSLALNFVILGLVLLPILSLITPEWRVPLLPDPAATVSREAPRPGVPTANPGLVAPENGRAEPRSGEGAAPREWPVWLLLVWLSGAIGCLIWLLLGDISLRWLLRKTEPVRGDQWRALLDELREEAGIDRAVRLRQSREIREAFISGVFRLNVVLPISWHRWSDQRLRMVLSHELAHIKRRDNIIEIPAKIALILYWCNPLAWLMVRRLRVERERACDNAVLAAGVKPSDYATQLMEVAADLGAFSKPLWRGAAISEGSGLKDRLLCILDPRLDRKPTRPYTAVGAAALIAVAVALLAPVTMWRVPIYSGESVASEGEAFNPITRPESAPPVQTMNDQRVAELIAMLDDECRDVRIEAVKALSRETGDHGVVAALRKMPRDADSEIRRKVAELLSVIDSNSDCEARD